jgi:hypothetical protein
MREWRGAGGEFAMAESKSSIGDLAVAVGAVVGSDFIVLFELIKESATLGEYVAFVWLNIFAAIWLRYYVVLGGAREEPGSDRRDEYEELRQSLESGGSFNLRYVEWLSWALDKVDAFFDGAEPSGSFGLARRVGWQADGPTWTAAAYDKCLLLALLYPLATMLALWVWSGEVGVAEKALGLSEAEPGDTGSWRFALGVAIAVIALVVSSLVREGWGVFKFLILAVIGTFAGVVSVAFGAAFVATVAGVGAVAGGVSGAVAVAMVIAYAGFYVGPYSSALPAAVAFLSVSASVLFLNAYSAKRGGQALFLMPSVSSRC